MLKLTKNKYEGTLIVFEGTDGAGKSTMIEKTNSYIAGKYGKERIIIEKQPTDLSRKTKLFQKMMYCKEHEDINYRAVQLLTLSDRLQHNHEIIVPALKEGKIVICDRYIYTSIANMLAREYKKEKWFFKACKEIIKPDLTFLAFVKPEIAIERIKARPEECRRHFDEKLLRNVTTEFFSMRKKANFNIIDTSESPDRAFDDIKNILDKVLERKYA